MRWYSFRMQGLQSFPIKLPAYYSCSFSQIAPHLRASGRANNLSPDSSSFLFGFHACLLFHQPEAVIVASLGGLWYLEVALGMQQAVEGPIPDRARTCVQLRCAYPT